MNWFLSFADDYLRGKEVYPPARRILNFLFSASITSFLFEKFYFKYQWMDISDYKGILNFFIKGDFFIPFSIFIIVHFGLWIFSSALFSVTMTLKSSKVLKNIINYRFTKKEQKDVRKAAKLINKNRVIQLPTPLTEEAFMGVYEHIKRTVPPEQIAAFEAVLEQQKKHLENNFILIVKAIIVITLYFFTIKHFGVLLYSAVILILVSVLTVLWWLYLGLDVLPAAMRKFDSVVQEYLQLRQRFQNESASVQANTSVSSL